MPKKPRFDNPLRLVREALGKTQPRFARMLGVSESALQKIELGKRGISPELADAVMFRFGVRSESLLPKIGKPVAIFPVADRSLREQMDVWMEMAPRLEADVLANFRKNIGPRIDALFEAAQRAKRGGILGMSLDGWIQEKVKSMELGPFLDAVLKERLGTEREVEWGRYVSIENAGPDEISVTVSATTKEGWPDCSTMVGAADPEFLRSLSTPRVPQKAKHEAGKPRSTKKQQRQVPGRGKKRPNR